MRVTRSGLGGGVTSRRSAGRGTRRSAAAGAAIAGAVPRTAVAVCIAVALAGTFALGAHARQAPGVTDGVYAAGQAERGREVYEAQCAICHGAALEGSVGPPLAGDRFLSIWSARPLLELVDKIQHTMPLRAPAPLSRQESLDLAAYTLQAGGYPAGQAALTDAALPGIVLPTAPSAYAAPGDVFLAPSANLAQLMRSIAFPASNIIFNVQIKDPSADVPGPTGARSFDYVEWGATVYPGWEAIDLAALALAESAPLFLAPGRRCENGRASSRGSARLAGVHRGGRGSGTGRLPGVAIAGLGRRHRGHRPAQRRVRQLPSGSIGTWAPRGAGWERIAAGRTPDRRIFNGEERPCA